MLECRGFKNAYGGMNVINVIVHIEVKTSCVNMLEREGIILVIFGGRGGNIQKNRVDQRDYRGHREVVEGGHGYPIVIKGAQIVINVECVIVYIEENLSSVNMLEREEDTRVTFGNPEGDIQGGHVKLFFYKRSFIFCFIDVKSYSL